MQASATRPAADDVDSIGEQVKDRVAEASPWIEGLGRFGYAAKGVVYLIIGALAVQAALGQGGEATDQRGAMAHIAEAPFGRSLLIVLAAGLVGYALWQVLRAVLDTDHQGTDAQGLLWRSVHAGVALIYLGLAWSAIKIATEAGELQGGTETLRDWTAWLMSQPLGPWLVGLVGACVILNGLFQFRQACKPGLTEDLNLRELDQTHREWITRIGRAGYVARGVAFVMIGGFLVAAALHTNPGEVQGLDGALATLAGQPFGPYLLGLVAAGLAAWGIFSLVEARYRRMVIC